MKINDTEKLNLAIVHGGRAYNYWDQTHGMTSYLTMILYELTIRKRLTQGNKAIKCGRLFDDDG